MNILVSACLLGINCRYDGGCVYSDKVEKLKEKYCLIPVCPEQLGGLSTPRIPASFEGERLITEDGVNVTKNFKKGAGEVLKIAKMFNVKRAIFKEKSPSCGVNKIYERKNGKNILISGSGITTKLLRVNNIEVISSEIL